MKGLDKYEMRVLAAYESGKLKTIPMSEAAVQRYREYARAALSKNQRVNIRVSVDDIHDIRARALEEGVPYQTLMASVLHKFATGRLIEKRSGLTSPSKRALRKRAATTD